MKVDKLFKKLLFLSLLIVFTVSATPPYMWYGTYNIDNYQGNGCPANFDLPRSSWIADYFNYAIMANESSMNGVDVSYEFNRRDDQVVATLWTDPMYSEINFVDFLFYAGHGNGFGPVLGCNPEYALSCYDISFGNYYLKWVQAASCLWFCPSQYANNVDVFTRWSGSFQGVHTVQGNAAITYQHYHAHEMSDLFWDYWVVHGYSIFGAWRNAQAEAIYQNGVPGLEPATMAPNSTFGTETFENAGNELAPFGATWFGHTSIGNPAYEL